MRNDRFVLRGILQHGPLSRNSLSRITGVGAATVGKIVNRLIDERVLQEIGPRDHDPGVRGGPRHVLIDFDPQGAAVLALVIGVYTRTVAIVDPRGRAIKRSRRVSRIGETDPTALDQMAATADDLIESSGLSKSAIAGIGIALEGLVDPLTGTRSLVPNRDFDSVPIRRDLEQRLGLPVVVANTAHAQATGEVLFGLGRNADCIVFVSLGTTVSCAAVIRNEVQSGHHHVAGAIGHVVVAEDGAPCPCGKRGCLETIVGENAIAEAGRAATLNGRETAIRELVGGDADAITTETVASAARDGDPVAVEIVTAAAIALGRVLATVTTLLDPETVIVEGTLSMTGGDAFRGPLERTIKEYAFAGRNQSPAVVASTLGPESPEVGAAALALERYFYSP